MPQWTDPVHWSTAVIEFVGGPSDGRTVAVPTPHMGRPPHSLYLSVEQPITLDFLDEPDPTYLRMTEALYKSTGVMSDDRHTWPYIYRGMR